MRERANGRGTFSVHTKRNLFRCFRCGAGGNALDLWSTYRRITIYDAYLELLAMLEGKDS